jgi:glycosyltransferase involved in cell wall biosynthesis
MKILAVVPSYPSRDTWWSCIFFKRWFEALPPNHDVDLLTLDSQPLVYVEGRFSVKAFQHPKRIESIKYAVTHPKYLLNHHGTLKRWLSYQKKGQRLAKIIKKGNYDVISSQFVEPSGIVAATSRDKHQTPISITGIGYDVATIPEIKYGSTLDKNRRDMISYSLETADRLSAVSLDAKQNMDRLVDSKRIDITPLGTDIDVPQSKLDTNNVLFVGQFNLRKNIKGLIQTAINVCSVNPAIKFSLIGEGELYDWAVKAIDRAQLKQNILLLGNPHGLSPYYQKASIYFHPSLHEGFGQANAEAMAHGVPVVSSTTGATPEVVSDSGFLFDPRDIEGMTQCILDLISDEKKRKEYGMKGRQRILEKFTWKRSAELLLEHLEKTIGD